jgi:cytochrome d ubiquinol oxidase subunit II
MFADIMAQSPVWLPVAFAVLMGVSIAAYVILDGYDLGVGLLMSRAGEHERDTMIASIGPFWDANETWLVLGVGLLLVAFPAAHGTILTALYLPTALMLVGLILRGVAFDFRAKAQAEHKAWWDRAFIFGSGLAAFTQGYMLGIYILGLERGLHSHLFGLITGLSLMAAYAFIGAGWLIMKSEGDLQKRAVRWARRTLWMAAAGMVLVSLATPWVSARIFEKWFSLPTFFLLLPIPLVTAGLFALLWSMLRSLPRPDDRWAWVPFAGAVGIFLLGFHGLAYSFYPYVVPEKLTVWEAASAPESLMIIFVGALVVLPTIIGYTIFAYRVFWGKTRALAYY